MAYPSIMLVAKLDFAGTSPERDMPPQAFRSRRSFYADYLASDHWRTLRAAKLKQSPACENCGRRIFLQVHHRRYVSPWTATVLDDLQTLCRFCHAHHHGVEPNISAAWVKVERPKYQPPITVPPLPALPRRKQARRAKLDQYRATERRHRISAEAKPGNSHFIIFPESVLFSRGRLDPDQHPKHASAQDVGHLSTAHDAGMRMTSPTASRSASPDLPKATP